MDESVPTTTAEGKLCEMHAQQGVSLTQKGPVYWPTAGELSLTLLGGVVFCSSRSLGSHAEMPGSNQSPPGEAINTGHDPHTLPQ